MKSSVLAVCAAHGSRVGGRLGVLLVSAGLLQSQRMPLVAAVVVAVALAPFAGLTRGRLDQVWAWDKSVWRAGDVIRLILRASNPGRHASQPVVVRLTGLGIAPVELAVPALRPGEHAIVVADVHLVGRRSAGRPTQRTLTHHRLIGRTSVTAYGGGPMLPAVRPQPEQPPADLLRRTLGQRDEGPGDGRRGSADPLLLRSFVPGDPVSSVHWRSTARTGMPTVLERERPASARLVLLVTATPSFVPGAHPGPFGAIEERLVARAAGLVQAAAEAGMPVTVVAAAGVIPSPSTHEEVQDWLAALGATGPAEPALLEAAVRQAQGGPIAILSLEPGLAAELLRLGATGAVLDLVDAW